MLENRTAWRWHRTAPHSPTSSSATPMTDMTRAVRRPVSGISARAPIPNLLARSCGLVVLYGVVGIVFGLLTLSNPLLSLAILMLLLAACSLVEGVATAAAAVANRRGGGRWGMLLAAGLAEIFAGIVVLAWPGGAAVAVLGTVWMGIALRQRRGRGGHPAAGAGAS